MSEEKENFGEIFKYTLFGYIAGLSSGIFLDFLNFKKSPLGQWLVRTLSGEGESVLEGIYALKQRILKRENSLAEAYGWGKLFGMAAPWLIDFLSRFFGLNVYGIEGFYIPYFYALGDQIGANISGMIFFKNKEGNWLRAFKIYIKNPVMLSSLIIIFIVPLGLFIARIIGFSPSTQTYTALETISANLCWVPPLIGLMKERNS